MKQPTKDQLQHDLRISKADSIVALANAFKSITRADKVKYMASGITITIKNINRKDNIICEEFMIADGLSDETIKAIQADIKASYDLKLAYNKI